MVKIKNKPGLIIGIIFLVLLLVVTGIYIFGANDYLFSEESFDVTPFFFKLGILAGGDSTTNIKITNNEEQVQTFNLYFNDLEGIASLSEEQFSLGAGETKNIVISFKDFLYESKVYVGQLIIEAEKSAKKIPVILNVESEDKYFSILQKPLPNYENIYPGGKLGMEIKLSNLKNYALHNIQVEYLIESTDGKTIFSDWEDVVIEEKLDFSKIIDVPKNVDYGEYVLITSVNYQNSKTISTYFFEIEKKKSNISLGNLDFFYIIILIIVLGMFWAFYYFVKSRNKLELDIQLSKQQSEEVKRNIDVISSYKKELKKIKNVHERNKKLEKLNEEKKKVIEEIKNKQKKQKKEFARLKKRGKKKEIFEKIDSWKKQGYKMFELKKEAKHIPKNRIKDEMKEWIKEGYNTEILVNHCL